MKPGDQIYLKKNIPNEVYQRWGISEELLSNHLGEMIEINGISDGLVTILVDGYYIQLSPEMYIIPKFQVGDVVTVAKREGKERDYPFCFTDEMTEFEGKRFKIKSLWFSERDLEREYYEEPFLYRLNSIDYTWSSAMFVQKEEQKLVPIATLSGIKEEGHAVKDCTTKIKRSKVNLKFE